MYQIDSEIIEQANECDRNFECLAEKNQPSCKISYCVSESVHFLKKLNRNCPYHVDFGCCPVCTCPVRKEIYNKYGV